MRDRCNWEKLVTVADFTRHPRQNTVVPKDFLILFRDEMMDYNKGELRLVL